MLVVQLHLILVTEQLVLGVDLLLMAVVRSIGLDCDHFVTLTKELVLALFLY